MSTRRVFLVGGAAALTGCTPAADVLGLRSTVKIAVSWSGSELRAFREVLDAVAPADYGVEIIPLGDDIAAAFGPRTVRRPDIVMLPAAGLVGTLRSELAALPQPASWPYADVWRELLLHRGAAYGVPFKFAHKSAIWYRRSLIPEPPRTWTEWLAVNASLVADGVAPLALAAADGWVLTDFFENVLLGSDKSAYDKLAEAQPPRLSHEPAVERALRMLGQLWAPPGTFSGGADRSLVQQFPDALVEAFGYRQAAMVVAPDFAEQIVRRFAADPDDVDVFTFPRVVDGGPVPLVAAGDVAVLPAPAGADARDLVDRLTGPTAAAPWIRAGGFLSPHRDSPGGYSAELARLAGQLAGGSAAIAFDLSDRLGPLGGSTGLQRVLQQFVARISGRGQDSVDTAVATALGQLREIED